jgi:hypothetical protein
VNSSESRTDHNPIGFMIPSPVSENRPQEYAFSEAQHIVRQNISKGNGSEQRPYLGPQARKQTRPFNL